MSKKVKSYSYEVKKKVVQLYYEGHSVSRLTKEYDLSHRNRIYEWRDKVQVGGYDALMDKRGQSSKGRTPKHHDLNEKDYLRQENERLQLQVSYLKKFLDLERG